MDLTYYLPHMYYFSNLLHAYHCIKIDNCNSPDDYPLKHFTKSSVRGLDLRTKPLIHLYHLKIPIDRVSLSSRRPESFPVFEVPSIF